MRALRVYIVSCCVPLLLPPHGNLHLSFAIRDQLAGQIDRDTLDGPGEAELTAVLLRRRRVAGVIAAGKALRPEHEQDRVGHVDAANQLAVDVQLAAGRHPVALGRIGLAGRLELVAQLDFTLRDRIVGMQPELVAADEIVQEVESLIFDEEDVTAGTPALGQQHPLCAALRDHHIGCDAPGPVVELGCGGEGDRRPAGVKDDLVPRLGDGRAFHDEAAADVAVDGENVVLARFCPPAADHLDQLVTLLGGQVVAFGVVLVHVVQLPVVGLDVHQHLIGDGGAKLAALLGGLGEARARPRADRPPAVVVDRAVTEHLEVLGVVVAGRSRLVEGVGEADPVDRRLGHAADALRRLGAQGFQDRRDEVDDVPIVLAASRRAPGCPWATTRCTGRWCRPGRSRASSGGRACCRRWSSPRRSG